MPSGVGIVRCRSCSNCKTSLKLEKRIKFHVSRVAQHPDPVTIFGEPDGQIPGISLAIVSQNTLAGLCGPAIPADHTESYLDPLGSEMNTLSIILITASITICICGLVFHLILLNKRVKELEQASLTGKGGLPRPVQDKLMDAIATLNYLQMNREVEDAYTTQLRNQLALIRDIQVKKDVRSVLSEKLD